MHSRQSLGRTDHIDMKKTKQAKSSPSTPGKKEKLYGKGNAVTAYTVMSMGGEERGGGRSRVPDEQ